MNNKYIQSGQSLLETIVAVFILTTTLTAGLGLTIYAFNSSSTSLNEIIASNLAREGVEVVRMMRDSNWLAGDSAGGAFALTACADLPVGKQNCYPSAFAGPSYVLSAGNFRLDFNSSTGAWSKNATAAYFLYLQANGTYTSTVSGPSVFARMINISFNSSAPYTVANPEMVVKSVVAWQGQKCTAFATSADLAALVTPCKIMVEEHMTNWKDYK